MDNFRCVLTTNTATCSRRARAWGAVELVHEELVVACEGHDLRPAVARHLDESRKARAIAGRETCGEADGPKGSKRRRVKLSRSAT